MPYTAKQKRFFGAELGRMKHGEKTKTGMSKEQLVEGIHAPTKKASRKHKRDSHRFGREI